MAKLEPGSRGRVLPVEDDVLNQIVAVGILGRLGHHADVAENGREAVAAVERGAYRAVLMDCQMPEMDGYQATAEIRRREGTARHVPVIAMTASATQADRDRCLAAGMDDFIAKPVLVDDLGAMLSHWLPAEFPAPPATAEPAREVLDHRRLDTLRELDDGQGSRLLTRLVAALLSGAPADLAGLRAAVERGDARAMGDVAHHLKGAAATLGSSRIVELCEDIESLAGADAYLVKPVEFFNLQSRLIAARRVTALHAELASYRAELSRLAHTDPLTRLGNRLSMEEELTALDARGRRYGHRYCLAMCDVDLFKTYNDTLGHHAGDEALQAVAARMKREVRSGDGVYRYGGRSSC